MDLPAILKSWFGLVDPEQLRAAITGVFQMVGVFVTGVVALVTLMINLGAGRRQSEQARTDERMKTDAQRLERIRDLQIALRADAKAVASNFRGYKFADLLDSATAQVLAGRDATPPYSPFVPRRAEALVWKSVADDIPLLPAEVIETVVLFYDQRENLRIFVEEFRTEDFPQLSAERKVAMLKTYFQLLEKHAFYATETFRVLNVSLRRVHAA